MRSIFKMIAYTNSPIVYDIMRLYSSRVRIPPYVATIAAIIMVTTVYSNHLTLCITDRFFDIAFCDVCTVHDQTMIVLSQ